MRRSYSFISKFSCSIAVTIVLLQSFALPVVRAQARAAASGAVPVPAIPIGPPPTEKELSETQEQLIKLLRLSPTLTTVVEHDPTLLSNQEYVERNNPQLGLFLKSHPEIARNPEFYLFTRLQEDGGGSDHALERAVWPELAQRQHVSSAFENVTGDLIPFLVFACSMGALVWLARLFLENRRWSRIFKLQQDVHGKLIDKFSSQEDLLLYMGTDAGKRFLEASPIPVNFEPEQRVPNAVARVLTPLQIGIVLTLLGFGFLMLRHVSEDLRIPMLVLGTVVLMPGVGFIISSAVTWVLAGRLGLMPAPHMDSRTGASLLGKDRP